MLAAETQRRGERRLGFTPENLLGKIGIQRFTGWLIISLLISFDFNKILLFSASLRLCGKN
jgi:hypothetical protein